MSEQIPIYDGEPQTQEQREAHQRLRTLFADLEAKQLDFLDEAGKSVIERVATLLAILFAVTAFSGTFPPPYLKGHPLEKALMIVVFVCYLLAMGMAVYAIQPRTYSWRRYSPQEMASVLQQMLTRKRRWVRLAGLLFTVGTVMLAVLVIVILWNA